jgi:1-acyl-sn-glycerol-3-phosphate acyltransferase
MNETGAARVPPRGLAAPPFSEPLSRPLPKPLGHLRAAWRLSRACAHVLRGLVTVYLVFPWLGVAAREVHIGRWARGIFAALGVRIERSGNSDPTPGAAGGRLIVANHVSWLDIMAILALDARTRFVAMAELQHWRGVAPLVAAARTIYLRRRSARDVLRVVQELRCSLDAGDAVAVFPEGIVSDGRTLGPFHGNLLQGAIDAGAPVLPLALRYDDAAGAASEAALFTGEITLMQSLWRLACADGLVLRLKLLPVHRAAAGMDRRELAAELRAQVQRALGPETMR